MNKLQKQTNPPRAFWSNVGYVLLLAVLVYGALFIYSNIRAESQAEQQREIRQQQEGQDQVEAAEADKEEEKKRGADYLRCQVEAEQVFIAARDQIPTEYSTSQHIQMLQTLEQKRSTDLDNCDRRKG